jgi:hypothetical protein
MVGRIAHGASFEEILEGRPDLEREDIRQAIEVRSAVIIGVRRRLNQFPQNPNAVSAAFAPVPDAITTNCRPSFVR